MSFRFLKSLLFTLCAIVVVAPAYADDYPWKYQSLVGPYVYRDNLVTLTESGTDFDTYTVKVSKTTADRALYLNKSVTLPANHKYFMKFKVKSSYTYSPYLRYSINGEYVSLYLKDYTKNEWCTGATIVTPTQEWQPTGGVFGILSSNNMLIEGETISVEKDGFVKIFDLTEIFGAGNEPADVEVAERLLLDIPTIKIATTKMVDDEFAPAEAKLATTVQTIESVVSRTIAQTEQIQILQDTKQTRPDENCPANMKCLLVQDEDGTPHWYPIIEP